MWHASGTADEYDVGSAWRRRSLARAMGEAVQGDTSLVGKARTSRARPLTAMVFYPWLLLD